MKLSRKTYPTFLTVLFLVLFIGTLSWEVLERIVSASGFGLDLTVGPYGFDAGIIAFWVKANPGTVLGIPGALLLFRSL